MIYLVIWLKIHYENFDFNLTTTDDNLSTSRVLRKLSGSNDFKLTMKQ